MFDDYLKAILAAYEYKKAEGTLPPNLVHPTPGNLKDQCLIVYRERYNPGDDDVLNLFFSASDKEKGYTKSIQNCNVDDLRQVKKILNRKTPNPGIKFIELIAWLIDFKPRPSILYYKHPDKNKTTNNPDILVPTEEEPDEQNSGEPQVTDDNADETTEQKNGELKVIDHGKDETGRQKSDAGSPDENGEDKETKPAKPVRRIPIYTVAISCIVLFLIAGTTFFFWNKKPDITPNTLFTSQKCMYWTGDHYEAVDCNEKVSDGPIVSLDVQKLTNFKKITSPDTLTKDALVKVWYTKIAGEHQYFTDSGVHPLDTQKKLRPLSRYILSNHISYYRHLLTLLVWSISVIIFFGLCSVLFIAFLKKRKKKTLALGSPEKLTALLLPSFQPNQETSNR